MSVTFAGAQLQVDLLDPGSVTPVRLFRHPGGDWDEPPPQHRNQRVDPPVGRESEYAVLYTAESIAAAAIECRILHCDTWDRYTYDQQRTLEYSVVRYAMRAPALFIAIDGENKRTLVFAFRIRRTRSTAQSLTSCSSASVAWCTGCPGSPTTATSPDACMRCGTTTKPRWALRSAAPSRI